jgi:hypothetical protein
MPQRPEKTSKSYGIRMEFVWNPYGIPMEHHAGNAPSTPEQKAINTLATGHP